MFNFTGATDTNYMRIPLSTFAVAGDLGGCDLYIQQLNYTENFIVLGSMFF